MSDKFNKSFNLMSANQLRDFIRESGLKSTIKGFTMMKKDELVKNLTDIMKTNNMPNIAFNLMSANQIRDFIREAELRTEMKGFTNMKKDELVEKLVKALGPVEVATEEALYNDPELGPVEVLEVKEPEKAKEPVMIKEPEKAKKGDMRLKSLTEQRVIENDIGKDGKKVPKNVKIIQRRVYERLGGSLKLNNIRRSMKGGANDALVMDLGKKVSKRNLNELRLKPLKDINYNKEYSVFPFMTSKML